MGAISTMRPQVSPSSSEEGFGEENAANRVSTGSPPSSSDLLPNPSSEEEGLAA